MKQRVEFVWVGGSMLTAWGVAVTPATSVTGALGGDARYDPTVLDNQQTSKQRVDGPSHNLYKSYTMMCVGEPFLYK